MNIKYFINHEIIVRIFNTKQFLVIILFGKTEKSPLKNSH